MTEPDEMVEIYQFEACPYCKKVREKLNDLQIDFIARQVKPGSDRSRVEEISGQTGVPVLVDPNKDTVMQESDDIVDHLEKHYG